MANKVEFGISKLHVGLFTTGNDGEVTMGNPVAIPGAVSFSPEAQVEDYTFYADNVAYWSDYSEGKIEGDLEVAKFPDTFLTSFMGMVALPGGGIGSVRGAAKPDVNVMFQVEGDAESRRIILYNGKFGAIKHDHKTIEESKEVETETVSASFIGDQLTGLTKSVYKPGDDAYDDFFTSPPAPSLEAESE